MQEESRMISSGSSSSAHKDKGRNSNVARMLKLTASILSISLFVMMMMFWGGGIDDDYDSSTSTFLHRQLSSLEQFMDPKSTNLRTGLQSEDETKIAKPRFIDSLPADPRIFFIHVGKGNVLNLYSRLMFFFPMRPSHTILHFIAGGMTLRNSIISVGPQQARCAYQNSLHGEDYHPCYTYEDDESQIDKNTLGQFHQTAINSKPEEIDWLLDNTNMFLYPVRDPISRLISAYNYHKSSPIKSLSLSDQKDMNMFYVQCFPGSFDDMVGSIASRIGARDNHCRELGIATLTSSMDHRVQPAHFKYGYQYYVRRELFAVSFFAMM